MSITTLPGRWVRAGSRRSGLPHECRYCCRINSTQQPDCRPTTCRACGSRVCLVARECPVCLVGYLANVSYIPGGRVPDCGYAKCGQPAVAKAPRVRHVCAEHASRARRTTGPATVREYIVERLAVRDGQARSGSPYDRYRLVEEVAAR